MNVNTKTGFDILKVALAAGLASDLLLRQMPWGLNVLLFNLGFVAGVVYLLRRRAPEQLTLQTMALLGAQVFFSAMFVWRSAGELRFADTLAIFAVLSALFLTRLNILPRVAGVAHYGISLVWSGLNALISPLILVFSDIEWHSVEDAGWRKQAFSVVRGIAIAAPLVLIFGALFMAADAAYEGLVQRVFDFDATILFQHAFTFGFFAWLSAGYLRGVLLQGAGVSGSVIFGGDDTDEPNKAEQKRSERGVSHMDRVRDDSGEYPVTLPDDHTVIEHINISDAPDREARKAETRAAGSVPFEDTERQKEKRLGWPNIENTILPPSFTLGTVEVAVILGLMNLLFLSFVIVQVPYLFGGMELVKNTPDFKLAEYARRGFGELVAVSALVLPVLLFGQWLIKKEAAKAQKLFKILAAAQIALLFVVMASAVQRLVLLTGNLGYGMTTVRLYPLIFMTWLAIVFVWFGLTVLRGARQHFAWGALWSAFFVLAATHVLNPDEFIVKTNVALMREGRQFDGYYNSNLSDDAMPALIEAFPDMSYDNQMDVLRKVRERYCRSFNETDLRSWNISRTRTAHLLHSISTLQQQYGHCEEVWLPGEGMHD
ncbi:MAG: DUF4173 domain-containing protein [Acidobacteria bacterium]|nr:DUF4173 domain-containing protein [Acidobacteriota bacterium]